MKLEGLVAFVTGGASGLGAETVKQFIEKGAKVAIADRNEELGEELAKTLGSSALFVAIDVTDEDDVKDAIKKTVEHFGALHIAVNCAGIAAVSMTLTSKTVLDFAQVKLATEINLYGTLYVSAYAAQAMSKNKEVNERGERGVIINVASVAAFEGQRGQVPYSATKAAVAGLTLPMARDLGKYGIRVATIAPGVYETPMTAMGGSKLIDMLSKDTPLRRLGKADEFAHMACSIVENSYLSGVTIRVDGATVLSHI